MFLIKNDIFLKDFSPSARLRLFIVVGFSAPNENEHVRPVAAAQLLLLKINTSMWILCRIYVDPVAAQQSQLVQRRDKY